MSPRPVDKNGVKRSVGGSIVHAKVLHTTGEGLDGAHIGMVGGAMADRFPPNGVFLVGEDELNEGGRVKLGKGSSEGAKVAGTGTEKDVAQAKGRAAVLFGRESIFAGVTQIVEANRNHVSHGYVENDIGLTSHMTNVMDKGNGDGLDTGGLWVDIFIAFDELAKAVFNFIGGGQALIRGPHPGHRLADGT